MVIYDVIKNLGCIFTYTVWLILLKCDRFQCPIKESFLKNKVSLEKNVTFLELRAYLVQKKAVAQNYLFIAIYFYHNIVCKNIVCDKGLNKIFSK